MITRRGKGDFPKIYRPYRISEVYGQDEVTKIIGNGLDEGTLPHSIIFYGTSGTGKTTLSNIIAMGLNCEKGPTSEPCCECENCMPVVRNHSMAYRIHDAGAYTGIDYVRKARLDFQAAPLFGGENKVELFDECHRLSKEAQDALLRSVEDAKEDLYFIFCTTEPGKINPPLRNRCMQFGLTPLSFKHMWELLRDLCLDNDLKANPTVMERIIKEAEGMPRNALWEMQKAIRSGEFSDGQFQLNMEDRIKQIEDTFTKRSSKPDPDEVPKMSKVPETESESK